MSPATRTLDRLGLAVVAALAALTILILSGRASAADPTKDAVKMIEDNQKLVIGFAYPTTKSVDSLKLVDDGVNKDGSFYLTVKFGITDSDGDPAHVTLKFKFDKSAKLTDVSETNRSSIWPSFATAKLVLEAVKAAIRNDDKLKDDPAWKQLLKIDSPQEFLCTLINIRSGK